MDTNLEKKLPRIEDYASIEAICDGVPVYSFNHLIYVHGQSPDFYAGTTVQKGNQNLANKLKLKKSWELKHNFVGICHEFTPRTRENDSQPFLPIHLIDGDPETIWASFECFAPDANDEWIRIDLPMESEISAVSLKCVKRFMNRDSGAKYRPNWHYGDSLPKKLSVKVSKDAWHWDTMFVCEDLSTSGKTTGDSEDPDGVTIVFEEPIYAKQILITGKVFAGIGYEGYMFSLSGVEVMTPKGENLALVSRGTGVTVSSTSNIHNSDRYSANTLWGPLQYDLGCKWVKFGSDNGSLLWCFTEHEKGVLKADEDADAAVTEAVDNGINIVMTLDFLGNWIYEDPPRKDDWMQARFREINESYICGIPLVDYSPEMFEGYLKYVEYMVKHFKGRVKYFEVGNEWHGWHDNVNWYKNTIFEPTYKRIKEADPKAQVMLCSPGKLLTMEILELLGVGVMTNDGKLEVPCRGMFAAKGIQKSDVIVTVNSDSVSPSGIVFNYKDMNDFHAAIYDPQSGQIFFTHCQGNHSWGFDNQDVVYYYPHHSVTRVDNMGSSVHMELKSGEKGFVFTVSDGEQTASATYHPECTEKQGSVGMIRCPGEVSGTFSAFSVMDHKGIKLFLDDFSLNDTLPDNWEITWSHWGDPNLPPAAVRLGAIGWHTGEVPDHLYFDKVKKFKADCEARGFNGAYFCNEVYAGAGYPPGPVEGNFYRMTDIQEAKFYIRNMVGHSSLNVEAGPCHVHFTGFPHPQSTCRTTVPSQVLAPSQPKPTHYAIRNICTAMDDFYESNYAVTLSDDTDIVYFTLENTDKTEAMISLFLEADFTDSLVEKSVDIGVKGMKGKKAWGIDVFNGTELELNMITDGDDVLLKDIIVKDYPILIRLKKATV